MGFFLLQAALSAAAVRYVAPRHPSSVRCDSHGATAAALQVFPRMTDMNHPSAYVFLNCVCHPRIFQEVGIMNTYDSAVQLQIICSYCAMLSAAAVYASPSPPNSVRCDSHGVKAAAFQGIPFVATTNGVLVRARVCACLSATLNAMWTIATHASL